MCFFRVKGARGRERARGGRGAYSFVACLSHLTIDHASPHPFRDGARVGGNNCNALSVVCMATYRRRTPVVLGGST